MEKLRRFAFIVVAVALFLATVMPSMNVSANMASSVHMVTMAATDGMNCPDCDTSRDNMVGCMQATCIGFAVIADGEYLGVSATRPAYANAAVAWPDDFKSAPSTPPI
ncbi:MAG: hypothetical protein Q8L53_17390 [Aestuariivirga sp.]|nr:hypothetical protein [Aestuariivirga sp.]